MNRNALILALVVGFGVYVWKDGDGVDPGRATESAGDYDGTTSQNSTQAERYLDEVRRERERIEQLKQDMEMERLNAELDRRINEQQLREQSNRAQEQARLAAQRQEWKGEFNDRADRREAWEAYNASKDAVSEVTNDDHWNLSPPSYGVNYSEDPPKQRLRRRYGDAATLEQNELD